MSPFFNEIFFQLDFIKLKKIAHDCKKKFINFDFLNIKLLCRDDIN